MSDRTVLQPFDGPIARIILNRPNILNVLDKRMGRELSEALHVVERTPAARALVIAGAGRSFMGGGDLNAFNVDLDRAPQTIGLLIDQFSFRSVSRRTASPPREMEPQRGTKSVFGHFNPMSRSVVGPPAAVGLKVSPDRQLTMHPETAQAPGLDEGAWVHLEVARGGADQPWHSCEGEPTLMAVRGVRIHGHNCCIDRTGNGGANVSSAGN